MDLFQLADQTARSFALTLRLLPGPVRKEVCLAYLIARLTDSVADASNSLPDHRCEALRSLDESLREGKAWPTRDLMGFAGDISHPGEAKLVHAAGELENIFLGMDESARRRGQAVLSTIISGQILDIERFEGRAREFVPDEASLLDYTWRVAGCVGEFWTDVLAAKLPGCLCLPVEDMKALGRRYGQGLQLLNILRDAPSDFMAGRCYLPLGEEENAHGKDGLDLSAIFRRVRVYTPLCREWLDDGIRYAEALRGRRVQAASRLPALIGHVTLNQLESADYQGWVARVKVPRKKVQWLLCQAIIGW